jgi:hypothetical protein
MTIDLGHRILVEPDFLGGSKVSQCTLRWTQDSSQREANYVVCPFECRTYRESNPSVPDSADVEN